MHKWTLFIKKFFTSHVCFCFYVTEFRKQKNKFCTSEASLCFTQKNSFCIMNKIKLVWFYSLCRNYFLSKNVIFSYILKIFFYHVTLENVFKILNNFVYFQNIVVCNEPLTVTLKWENVNYSKSTYISKLPHILQKKLGLLQVCSLNRRKC